MLAFQIVTSYFQLFANVTYFCEHKTILYNLIQQTISKRKLFLGFSNSWYEKHPGIFLRTPRQLHLDKTVIVEDH